MVARHYQMGVEERIAALDGVGFAIERGEMVAIVGSSRIRQVDAAKYSRLSRYAVAREISARRRTIVQGLSDDDLRARAQSPDRLRVPELSKLLHRASAQKNVALPLVYRGIPARQRNWQATKALARVGPREPAWAQAGISLSGGQRQLVAAIAARAS